MPTMWMMVGIPAAGKSTWIANQGFDWNNTVIISTDNIIEQRAKEQNKTYSEVFQSEIKEATAEMNRLLHLAVTNNLNIIWDQTNLSSKARANKLAKIPKTYKKIAVFFPTPSPEILQRNLNSRPGKIIPDHIMKSMSQQLEYPTAKEGFDQVISV